MLTKLNAIVIASLSLGGTGAMVENSHRMAIDEPVVAEVAIVQQELVPAQKLTFCMAPSIAGEPIFMQYIASVGDAMSEHAMMWCDEGR